jgi:hypothetical protein
MKIPFHSTITTPRSFLIAACLLAAFTHSASAQQYGLAVNQNISVASGQVCEILNFVQTGGTAENCWLVLNSNKFFQAYGVDSGAFSQPSPKNFFIPGPATITMTFGTGAKATCSYRLFPNGASVPVANLPSNSVVIPSNATGSVSIILESSSDFVTWTAANPGTYAPTTQNRFFRVRAVQQ